MAVEEVSTTRPTLESVPHGSQTSGASCACGCALRRAERLLARHVEQNVHADVEILVLLKPGSIAIEFVRSMIPCASSSRTLRQLVELDARRQRRRRRRPRRRRRALVVVDIVVGVLGVGAGGRRLLARPLRPRRWLHLPPPRPPCARASTPATARRARGVGAAAPAAAARERVERQAAAHPAPAAAACIPIGLMKPPGGPPPRRWSFFPNSVSIIESADSPRARRHAPLQPRRAPPRPRPRPRPRPPRPPPSPRPRPGSDTDGAAWSGAPPTVGWPKRSSEPPLAGAAPPPPTPPGRSRRRRRARGGPSA